MARAALAEDITGVLVEAERNKLVFFNLEDLLRASTEILIKPRCHNDIRASPLPYPGFPPLEVHHLNHNTNSKTTKKKWIEKTTHSYRIALSQHRVHNTLRIIHIIIICKSPIYH
ncbi:hypothetical protein Fmac_021075 [Flemingia macrophylla]|uniref:Uncharacterized protein n=1 Tax=Flemingia macrophylla TaxID=520843 RepID=A0ABD1LWC0_9FABA